MTRAADRMRTQRQHFAAPGGSLDRIVRVLAVSLPALVGVIAAMMLITPLSPRGEISFLLDRNKVAIADDRLRVDNAMYRGQDSKGRPFSLVAGEAVQESNSVPLVLMENITARMVMAEGPAMLTAPRGVYDIDDEEIGIPGMVRFTAADGYEFIARDVTVNLPARTLTGEGQVSGAIPAGSFSANAMRADLQERTFSLIGDARLRMVPGRLRLPTEMQ